MAAVTHKKLKCPSCSIEHDLNDYPGAFEIPCSCGYSILIPDLNAFLEKDEGEETRFESRVPTSMEAEEAPIPLEGDLSFEVADSPESLKNDAGAASLTPPEKLPHEMAYDPFEVASLASQEEAANAGFEMVESTEEPQSEELSAENIPSQTVASANLNPSSHLNSIITRNMLGSFGQLLGPEYHLKILDLSRELKIELLHKAEDLLRDRPWLDEEIRKKNIKLDDLVESSEIGPIPEILAIEFYLNAIELGGRVEIKELAKSS